MQYDHYTPSRGEAFEHKNFYLTFASMNGVKVSYFPFDVIKKIGKESYNARLLEAVRRERPDMVFAFMYSDEFVPKVLEELKRHTTTSAWFADDHWRLHNYSRGYAPQFTWAVTTWSKAPAIYARYGIKNIIRSQWACNPKFWKPVAAPRDMDVSFVGQYNSSRGKIVEELRRAGVDIWVRGWGWPEGRLTHEEMTRSFSRSKINLNFNAPPPRSGAKMLGRLLFKRSIGRIVPDFWNFRENLVSWYHMKVPQIKARPFEVLGCKTFLISAYADDMEKYYEDGKEIVYYDGSVADLVKKVQYYLPRDAERERIARAGYERTIKEHTYERRFRDLFQKIGLDYNQ